MNNFVERKIRFGLGICWTIIFFTGSLGAYEYYQDGRHQRLFREVEKKADFQEPYNLTTRDEWKVVYKKLGLEFKVDSDPKDLDYFRLKKYLEMD